MKMPFVDVAQSLADQFVGLEVHAARRIMVVELVGTKWW